MSTGDLLSEFIAEFDQFSELFEHLFEEFIQKQSEVSQDKFSKCLFKLRNYKKILEENKNRRGITIDRVKVRLFKKKINLYFMFFKS
jgi:hypothetical protein